MSSPQCTVSLMNGMAARLPLLERGGDIDLQAFLRRSVRTIVDENPDAAIGNLPLAMLILLGNDVRISDRVGEGILTTEALVKQTEPARREVIEGASPLQFTLIVNALSDPTCGVRRCRDGLTRQSCLRQNLDGYRFKYPVAFMVLKERVSFPEFAGIFINMMPFVLGKKSSLPENLHSYWPLIESCGIEQNQCGKIGYLTVDERTIREDQTTHRRGGLHTDSPGVYLAGVKPSTLAPVLHYSLSETRYDAFCEGKLQVDPGHPLFKQRGKCSQGEKSSNAGSRTPSPRSPREFHPRGLGTWDLRYHGWGVGVVIGSEKRGGIYMASNVDKSAAMFNAVVEDPTMIGHQGSCEHLRDYLGPETKLDAGELCWFTDRTPHESLPLSAGVQRQFFRLVTSEVGVWYSDHSTANPLGTVPDPKITRVLQGSKFERRND